MSTNFQPKTTAQVRCIFGIARNLGMGDDLLHETVLSVTSEGGREGTSRISQLSYSEAETVIQRLKAQQNKQTPRRTIQYRRQRAGAKQIATAAPSQLELMRSLAHTRGMSDAGLESLCNRMLKHYPPRTTAETNKVIEALKAMNARDML